MAWEAAGAVERSRNAASARQWAHRAVALANGSEEAVRQQIELFGRLGDRPAAVDAYEDLTARLRDEYGIEPSEETSAALAGVLAHPIPKAAEQVPAEAQISTEIPRTVAPASGGVKLHTGRRRPVVWLAAGIAVILALALGWWLGQDAETRAVAVIPFVDLSAHSTEDYFAEGVTEEILNSLAQIPNLRVPARTSAFRFRGLSGDVEEIGRQLRVGTVLEGSVRRSGGRVRITAQLIDTRTGYHLWSGTFDRELTDLFAVQEEIAQSIADTLRVHLRSADRDRLARRPTSDPEAYLLLLKGRHTLQQRTLVGLRTASGFFSDAIRRDPAYAAAYAGLAEANLLLAGTGRVPAGDVLPVARRAADRAIGLDPKLVEAHIIRAGILMQERRWQESESAFRAAIRMGPPHPTAHHWYSVLLTELGRPEEAVEQAKRALQLDPLSPAVQNRIVQALYFADRYEEAAREAESGLQLEPESQTLLNNLAATYLAMERYADAERVLQRRVALGPSSITLSLLASLYIHTGRHVEAVEVLKRLEDGAGSEPTRPLRIAVVHAARGDLDLAFAWLGRVEWYPDGITTLRSSHLFDPLRTDPRYSELLRSLALR